MKERLTAGMSKAASVVITILERRSWRVIGAGCWKSEA
jgi:hypothetical protein